MGDRDIGLLPSDEVLLGPMILVLVLVVLHLEVICLCTDSNCQHNKVQPEPLINQPPAVFDSDSSLFTTNTRKERTRRVEGG
jgi:hypothetical protein